MRNRLAVRDGEEGEGLAREVLQSCAGEVAQSTAPGRRVSFWFLSWGLVLSIRFGSSSGWHLQWSILLTEEPLKFSRPCETFRGPPPQELHLRRCLDTTARSPAGVWPVPGFVHVAGSCRLSPAKAHLKGAGEACGSAGWNETMALA